MFYFWSFFSRHSSYVPNFLTNIKIQYFKTRLRHFMYCCIALGWRFVDWPCRLQRLGQRQEARTGQGGPGTRGIIREEEPGPKECPVNTRVLNPFPGKAGERVQGATPSTPSSPSGQPGQGPTTPLHRATPSPRKLSSRIDLGENLVLASKSGSEVMVRAQDDRMKHFWLNGISLRGQTAELETSAG